MSNYMTAAEIAKEIRAALKSELFECKFSVTCNSFSGGREISVSLMAAPFQPMVDGKTYAQINHYCVKDDPSLTAEARKVLGRANEIGNQRNWDRSDHQTDYSDVNFYFNLNVGKWDRPFVQSV